MQKSFDRIKILGIEVNPVSIEELNSYINICMEHGISHVIANHNIHSIYLFHKSELLRGFYKRADVIHIDGMPLVKWAKLLGLTVKNKQRVTYVDWIHPLMREAESKKWLVYFVGGREETGNRAAEKLKKLYPALEIRTSNGYFEFGSEEERKTIHDINLNKPNILMVGMGMPRQEMWISRNITNLSANVILPVGACMDYVAGEVPTPPRWLGNAGLEWMFRLKTEPVRLAKRYLVEPWSLIPWMIRDLSRKGRTFND